MSEIPFVDLYAQYLSIKDEVDEAIRKTIKNASYIGGDVVTRFENSFADYLGIKHMIGCANGTDSIEILLKAFEIGAGDEVIVPAISWISTSEAVSSTGATPVFVDIEEDYFTINPLLIEKAITAKTKAIIPVHLYGHPADMPAIMKIAETYRLIVIEDCAQAHGAKINGQKTGTFGHAGSFSFYPGKNLGAYGDAGCMVTNDDLIARKARMIANHGQQGKHHHIIEGRNSRLDGMQAAILMAKLPHLDQWTEARISNAGLYHQLLEGKRINRPLTKENYKHVFHLYVVRTGQRDELQKKLSAEGIGTSVHYPVALPFLPCYSRFQYKPEHFPVAYLYQNQILSLPMFPELTEAQITTIAEKV